MARPGPSWVTSNGVSRIQREGMEGERVKIVGSSKISVKAEDEKARWNFAKRPPFEALGGK